MKAQFITAFCLFVSANHLAQASEAVISQRDGSRISVNTHNSKVSIATSNATPIDIAVDSEKELHIDTADYNFD